MQTLRSPDKHAIDTTVSVASAIEGQEYWIKLNAAICIVMFVQLEILTLTIAQQFNDSTSGEWS